MIPSKFTETHCKENNSINNQKPLTNHINRNGYNGRNKLIFMVLSILYICSNHPTPKIIAAGYVL